MLRTKLRRDLLGLRAQIAAVALVMACGVALMIGTRGLIRSLNTARDTYYASQRFAEGFADVKSAPRGVLPQIAEIVGVNAVEASIVHPVLLTMPGVVEGVRGLATSLPDDGLPTLNIPLLRAGRWPRAGNLNETLVSEAFAKAHHLAPGDTLAALVNGTQARLTVVGVVLAPQFVFESPISVGMPDPRVFGALWMPEGDLGRMTGLDGAFNSLAFTYDESRHAAVFAAVDEALRPYGGSRALDRSEHAGNRRLNDELKLLADLSVGFPFALLGVAVFMVHSVVTRQIALQREQIAVFKAFGLPDRDVGAHFLQLGLLFALAGVLLGVVAGQVLGLRLMEVYRVIFYFPSFDYFPSWGAVGASAAASFLAVGAGVSGVVRRVARLAPAVAMRAEPPAEHHGAAGRWRRAPIGLRMVLRKLRQKPARAALMGVAVAVATGLLMVPRVLRDSLDYVADYEWGRFQTGDATVRFIQAAPLAAADDFAKLPDVLAVQAAREVPVELLLGDRTSLQVFTGLDKNLPYLKPLKADGGAFRPRGDGVWVSRGFAEFHGLRPGQRLRYRVLEGRRREGEVIVEGLVENHLSASFFVDLESLNRWMGDGERINVLFVGLKAGDRSGFWKAVRESPRVDSALASKGQRQGFLDGSAKSVGFLQAIFSLFALTVAVATIYNATNIALSERQRELVTLRVLGFGRGTVNLAFVGEIVAVVGVGLPLGLWLGGHMATGFIGSINNESLRFPVLLDVHTRLFAVSVIGGAALVCTVLACRRLHRLSMVDVMKARE